MNVQTYRQTDEHYLGLVDGSMERQVKAILRYSGGHDGHI